MNWNQTQDCLRNIELNASWMHHYCGWIKSKAAQMEFAIKRLKERPRWETMAEVQLKETEVELTRRIAEMKKCAQELQLCLALSRSALQAMDLKPIAYDITEPLEAAE